MLEERVPLTGRPNALRGLLGDGAFAFLLDVFMYAEGPRVRGRLSHGDAQLASVPPSLADELLLLLAALALPDSAAAHHLAAYTPRYHPKALLRLQLLALHAALTSLAAALALVAADAAAPPPDAPAEFVECLRHLAAGPCPPLATALAAPPLPPPVSAAATLFAPPAVLARVVCVRKLCEKLRAVCALAEERTRHLRQQTAAGGAGRRVVAAFDRLVATLPRLASLLAAAARFAFGAAAAVQADGAQHDVRLLQRATVCVEKAAAPLSEHSWAKAEASLAALAELVA